MKPAVAVTAALLIVVLLVSVALLLNNMLTVKTYEPQRVTQQGGVRLHTGATKPYDFPVDVVFTWCKETPERAALRKQYKRTQANKTREGADRQAPVCTSECEIHYAVKSVRRFMPWVQTIYVFTPQPQDPQIPGTVVIFNEQLCDDPAAVPTFNSHVVESWMHRIPNLAEHFIYFNDDMMVGQPLHKSMFFTPQGKPILYKQKQYRKPLLLTNGFEYAWYNLSKLWEKRYPKQPVWEQIHQASALTLQLCLDAEDAFSSLYAAVRATRLRDKTNVPPVALALNYGAVRKQVEVVDPAKVGVAHVNLYRRIQRAHLQSLVAHPPHFFCVNNVPNVETWALVRGYLDALFVDRSLVALPPSPRASVPRRIWQTWHTKELPRDMQVCVQKVREAHPDFDHVLMDDRECDQFIQSNYAADVSHAFQELIPGAYKADLWRLCVLYKFGGIYLDIKFSPAYGKFFHPLLTGSHFVRDKARRGVTGIYNGFMVCAPGDARLMRCIDEIVKHVQLRFYGSNSLAITGPQVLNKFVDPHGDDVDLAYNSTSVNHRFIQDAASKEKLLVSYPAYNAEQKETQTAPYYTELWRHSKVYAFGNLPSGLHLHFLEIGTSDFDTCIQDATDATWGMSVEAIAFYLNRLPDKPGVKKVQQAVSNHTGSIDIYYTPLDVIQRLGLPNWVRGSNSVSKPHAKVLQEMKKRRIVNPESYFAKDSVRVTDMETLLKEQNVSTFQYLKLDTEGHDCVILQSLLRACERNKAWFPRKILFETNMLTSKAEVDMTCALFKQQGYTIKRGKHDSEMIRQW